MCVRTHIPPIFVLASVRPRLWIGIAEDNLGTKKAYRRPLSKRESSKSAPFLLQRVIGKPDPTPLLLAVERNPQEVRGILRPTE